MNKKYQMKKQIDMWFVSSMHDCMNTDNAGLDFDEEARTVRYMLDMSLVRGKRFVLFGAGRCGIDYMKQLDAFHVPLLRWVASRPCVKLNREVSRVDSIQALDFDLVVIAISDEDTAEEMRGQLLMLGVPEEKIIWPKPFELY